MAARLPAHIRGEFTSLSAACASDATVCRMARGALMWLSVATRPLRAAELRLAVQIERSLPDAAHIEGLLSTPWRGDSAAMLGRLLGRLVCVQTNGEVELACPQLRTALYAGEQDVGPLGFTVGEAHGVLARVCMAVCSVSTLRSVHGYEDGVVEGVVRYAWTSWRSHLAESRCMSFDESAASEFDSMVLRVCTDALVFLLALNDVVTGPLTVPATEDRLRYAASVLRAQRALEKPITLLSVLVRLGGYAKILDGARESFVESSHSKGMMGSRSSRQTVSSAALQELPRRLLPRDFLFSNLDSQQVYSLLATAFPSFREDERRVILAFGTVAKRLRAAALIFGEAPLHAELLKQLDIARSPTNPLAHMANWMEGVASYPFWPQFPAVGSLPNDPVDIGDTTNEKLDTASLLRSKARNDVPSSEPSSHAIKKPSQSVTAAGSTTIRSRAARLLETLHLLQYPPKAGATYAINNPSSLFRRASSFSHIPAYVHGTGDPFAQLTPFIPASVKRLYRQNVARLYPNLPKPLVSFRSTDSVATLWPQVKSSILTDGHHSTALYFLAAILLHHVRRTLVPWLAAYTYHTPIEDLRLVLSRADLFLDETLAPSWSCILFTVVQKPLCDAAASTAVTLLINDGSWMRLRHVRDITLLVYLTWSLAALEYMVDRTASTAAHAIAYLSLLNGGSDGRFILARVLRRHPAKSLWNAYQTASYVFFGLIPLLVSACRAAARGQPALLLISVAAVSAVWVVLRYRSRLYIAIELSGLCVVVGLMLAGAVLLVVDFIEDPLGTRSGTARARRVAAQARRALPREVEARAEMIRGRNRVAERLDDKRKHVG